MRVTGLGHAGMFVETAAGSVLCDPWVTPAYFGSWVPFPDNTQLDWDAYLHPDYLYVSHLHRDHFDPDLLARVDRSATVLLPDYPVEDLRDALAGLGFESFVHTRSGEPVELDGLTVVIQSLVAPADGPIGDSALILDDGTARLLNQNDARPDLGPLLALGEIDAHALQFSGAIWWPWTYTLPDRAKAEFGRRKRANGLARARNYVEQVGARHVLPIAGPACFLDEELQHLNDTAPGGDPTNTFPDQRVFLAHLAEHGHTGGALLLPGTVATFEDGGCEVRHLLDEAEIEEIFERKADYLARFAERRRPALAAERSSRRRLDRPLLEVLKERWEPLLSLADNICAGVGAPVQLTVSEGDSDESVVIDFPAREVRAYAGETCPYRFEVQRDLVEACLADEEPDWVNRLFLSLRFRATRIGPYNEYVYTFFKCLTQERISYAEGWYANQQDGSAEIELDGWQVQRRCPHLSADLTRFGVVEGDVLTCQLHGWQFELPTGRCLTSDGYSLRSHRKDEPARVAG